MTFEYVCTLPSLFLKITLLILNFVGRWVLQNMTSLEGPNADEIYVLYSNSSVPRPILLMFICFCKWSLLRPVCLHINIDYLAQAKRKTQTTVFIICCYCNSLSKSKPTILSYTLLDNRKCLYVLVLTTKNNWITIKNKIMFKNLYFAKKICFSLIVLVFALSKKKLLGSPVFIK